MKVSFAPLIAVLGASLLWSGHADAQVRVGGGVFVGRPYHYRPIYRPYLYDPFFYGAYYRPFYWYPYSAVGFGYGYARFDGGASLRVQVMPRDTEVYIDNYYAGTVDDFDGVFQRLHVEPGAHDITLYREGYRTVRQRIYLQPTGTFRLRYNMMPLAPGEAPEPRPVEPSPGPQGPAPYPPSPYPPAPRALPAPGGEASLSIRVQPGNADVFIDGERWEGPAGEDRLVVQVAAGVHHVEVRRDGYRTYATDITARPGEASTVNISLSRQP